MGKQDSSLKGPQWLRRLVRVRTAVGARAERPKERGTSEGYHPSEIEEKARSRHVGGGGSESSHEDNWNGKTLRNSLPWGKKAICRRKDEE